MKKNTNGNVLLTQDLPLFWIFICNFELYNKIQILSTMAEFEKLTQDLNTATTTQKKSHARSRQSSGVENTMP